MTANHARAAMSGAVRALQIGQHALFALLYVVALILTFARGTTPWWGLACALGLGAWYLVGIAAARHSGRRGVGAAWIAGLLAWWIPVALVAPPFRYLVLPLFLLALHLLPRIAGVAVVVALTAFIIAVQLHASPADPIPQVLGPTLGAIVALLFASGYRAVLEESRQKSLVVAELTAARDDLEAVQLELAQAQREAGAAAERSRLARDIHDTLAQGFSSIVLLSRAGLTDPGRVPELLSQIEQTAAENLDEARRVVHALAPAALEDSPLAAALARLAERASSYNDLRVEFEVEGDVRPVPTAVEVDLLRLTQGALANIRQHAQATRARVTLGYSPHDVSVDIVDDGVGFDPATVPVTSAGGGFGLRAMRQRIAELGGTLEIESAPGDGTAVVARIPVEA